MVIFWSAIPSLPSLSVKKTYILSAYVSILRADVSILSAHVSILSAYVSILSAKISGAQKNTNWRSEKLAIRQKCIQIASNLQQIVENT